MDVIETFDLTKYYRRIRGIEGISLSVQKGEIFGFLGPNGAGKTTMIRTLLGFLKPTGGHGTIFGLDIVKDSTEIKPDVGYIPGDLSFYGYMTGRQFLSYFDGLRGFNGFLLEDLLSRFDLPLDRKIKGYSKGMKQKLGIVQAFMHDPELVIMDEPTSGLDPLLQQEFYEFLLKEKDKGKTMFFSSHILSEVDKICDRVAIIRDGELVALEDVDTLKDRRGKKFRVRIKEDPSSFSGPSEMTIRDGWIEFTSDDDIDRWVKKLSRFTVLDLEIQEFSLEDIFLRYYRG